jgi:Xaa-Pro aminopeptidase
MQKKFSAHREQLAALKEAVPVLRDGFAFVERSLVAGITERQMANRLRAYFRSRGYSTWAFRFIVAFGPGSAEPHHWPTDAKLRDGQFVKIDIGLTVRGWKSDVTRTFLFGRTTARHKKIYRLVLQAQQRATRATTPGVTGAQVDAAARDFLKQKGYGKTFVHSTGHGLGKAIHQPPWLSPRKGNRPLRAGEVVTIEPGIYLKGFGGVRIEDMILVTAQGAKNLSSTIPK